MQVLSYIVNNVSTVKYCFTDTFKAFSVGKHLMQNIYAMHISITYYSIHNLNH